MRFFNRKPTEEVAEKNTSNMTTPAQTPPRRHSHHDVEEPQGRVPIIAVILGAVASIGGFMFGYESGQISGFLAMTDFIERFGENGEFSAVRQGTIVGLLCIGTLFGCLGSAPLADNFGRRLTISGSAFWYIVGVIIEITSKDVWVQFAMGRFTAGLGIGALSTVVPMYQSESIPKRIRGATVSSYQLLITLGIWTAYMVNYGTSAEYHNSAQWRIPNGLSALWAIILGSTILLLPESPRYAYRKGRIEEARRNMARLNGVAENSAFIDAEIKEIQEKLDAESAGGDHPWHEIFTGPRMLYRTILGMVLQAGQQLTGANYFFYYGTTIFSATGLDNSYVTSIILGTVNVAATIVGLWIVENVGRRKAMIAGALWMFVCLFIYAFVGHYQLDHNNPTSTPQAGNIMIVFTCLFIAAFATTWGPLVWAIVGELYPARYRATCMGLATASNWLFNFLISFFSTMITNNIDYFYGLVFGACCAALAVITYFFMIETKGRSLEEIDTMYVLHVNPITSAKWTPESLQRDGLVDTDRLHVGPGGRSWSKAEQGAPLAPQHERAEGLIV
ncbi:hexose transporter hxt5 [Didymosphaeria variabile]|uniref:Hexose transporter hxt5 n=1 Tax=Didymosphaeria variabile TaxID=1932322 RepID=A0A9W9C757_9PLEO|nr:hexose transporter hxt5 [Didymosphaeria variabile]KAJ4347968.1 hexose transporter hxt5 [Didymosphaeria variabile]